MALLNVPVWKSFLETSEMYQIILGFVNDYDWAGEWLLESEGKNFCLGYFDFDRRGQEPANPRMS